MKYVCRAALLEITAINWKIFPRKQVKNYLKTLSHPLFSRNILKKLYGSLFW